jgi:anti-sigma factor RsiW
LQIQTTDPLAIEQWFSGKLDWPVTLPRFAESDIVLEGARLCKILNTRIALVFYQRQKRRCSLFVFPDTSTSFSEIPETYLYSANGYTIHYWKKNRLLYSLVAPQ